MTWSVLETKCISKIRKSYFRNEGRKDKMKRPKMIQTDKGLELEPRFPECNYSIHSVTFIISSFLLLYLEL